MRQGKIGVPIIMCLMISFYPYLKSNPLFEHLPERKAENGPDKKMDDEP
jgi:hypothetical protein